MTVFSELATRLQQELSCTESLLSALETERQLLESRDLAGLQLLLTAKSESLDRLEHLRRSRKDWLQVQGLCSTDNELLTVLEESANSEATFAYELLSTCIKKIDKCNYLNELNGILISNSRKRNSRQLDLMRGISQEQKLYTASGNTTSRTSQNNVGRA